MISSALQLNGAVPQSAISGMDAFVIMIDDLKTHHDLYKYVDDCAPFEVVENSNI